MTFNPFRKWQQKRQQKKQQQQRLKALNDTASRFRMLEQLEKKELLIWDPKTRRLFIASDVAVLFMGDAEKWIAFIHNIHEWLYYRLCQKAWDDHFRKEEISAVRNAITIAGSNLSREDIARIKRSRREEIALDDMQAPAVEPFEFLLVPASTEPAVEPIAVGYFNPESREMEMASWKDVKQLLEDAKDAKKKKA